MDESGDLSPFFVTKIIGANALVNTLSPIIMVQWKMAGYLKGNDPIGDTGPHFFNEPWSYGKRDTPV